MAVRSTDTLGPNQLVSVRSKIRAAAEFSVAPLFSHAIRSHLGELQRCRSLSSALAARLHDVRLEFTAEVQGSRKPMPVDSAESDLFMRYKADITAGALKLPESRLIAIFRLRKLVEFADRSKEF